eukprot:29026-Pelagococcus_subviridis.AAC.19
MIDREPVRRRPEQRDPEVGRPAAGASRVVVVVLVALETLESVLVHVAVVGLGLPPREVRLRSRARHRAREDVHEFALDARPPRGLPDEPQVVAQRRALHGFHAVAPHPARERIPRVRVLRREAADDATSRVTEKLVPVDAARDLVELQPQPIASVREVHDRRASHQERERAVEERQVIRDVRVQRVVERRHGRERFQNADDFRPRPVIVHHHVHRFQLRPEMDAQERQHHVSVPREVRVHQRDPPLAVRDRPIDVHLVQQQLHDLRVVPYKAISGWSSKASAGVERRRGRALKASGGRRCTTAKVLKDRRSPRERGRMGTSI